MSLKHPTHNNTEVLVFRFHPFLISYLVQTEQYTCQLRPITFCVMSLHGDSAFRKIEVA
jgi:hypothetical protein